MPVAGWGAIAVVCAALALPAAGAAAPTAPLTHPGKWIVDARGRTVILRGFNVVAK